MKLNLQFSYLALLCSCVGVFALGEENTNADPEPHVAKVMKRLSQEYYKSTLASLPPTGCTSKNIAVRQDWDSLSKAQRRDYLRAVNCMYSKPSINDDTPARSRMEDFVLSHTDQTLFIHVSGLLLPWHRYFTYLYEKALREECGYKGYQPYWDWSKYAADPSSTSVFDGSEFSFGGNGKLSDHGPINVTLPGGPPPGLYFIRQAGTGGGCITDGPFANTTLYLDAKNKGATTPVHIFDKPRCIKRDFYLPTLQRANSYQNVTDLILNSPNIHVFHPQVEKRHGIHGGGHEFIGGENLNLFTSPGDPIFYLHHAMLDRVWAIWQSRDISTRQFGLDGTLTDYNYPPTNNATVWDHMDFGDLSKRQQIVQAMSTTNGPFCYIYK